MKKMYKLTILSIIFSIVFLSCGEKDTETIEQYEARMNRLEILKYYNIQDVMQPRIVNDGVLFTFAENYDSVEVSGDFNNWEDSIPLIKSSYGVYYYLWQHPLKAGKYSYRYRVNGVWINDPVNANIEYDNNNQVVSYFVLTNDVGFYEKNPIYNSDGTVTFFYSNDTAKEVMFTSDKLGFDSLRYPMTYSNNLWVITLRPEAGNYYYNFVVDRIWEVDPINMNVYKGSDGRLHSYILINYNQTNKRMVY
ncbi:protein kinase [Brachyspira hampsonii]|uniref:Protein kinase n=1 Tax=Brachyspira hampsonii TaxID=1287055 RepID=A0A1E5NEY6_9SPIR|nr:protein kinase [Brachyspira hampsonii]OEJ14703.1 protein kinase [Brachyspira hampsonii]